jgi:hypothetical protein
MNQIQRAFTILLFPACVACGNDDNMSIKLATGRDADDSPPPECAEINSVADGLPCQCSSDCRKGAMCWTERDTGAPQGECVYLCDSNSQCAAGDVCWSLGEVRHIRQCMGSCMSGKDCGSLFVCDEGQCCASGACRKACETQADCDPSRICLRGVCVPGCDSDSDCHHGSCNRYTARCEAMNEELAGLAAPCLRNDECRSGECDTVYFFCRTDCSPETNTCPENGACVMVGSGAAVGHTCLPRCESDADCPYEPQHCVDANGTLVCPPSL